MRLSRRRSTSRCRPLAPPASSGSGSIRRSRTSSAALELARSGATSSCGRRSPGDSGPGRPASGFSANGSGCLKTTRARSQTSKASKCSLRSENSKWAFAIAASSERPDSISTAATWPLRRKKQRMNRYPASGRRRQTSETTYAKKPRAALCPELIGAACAVREFGGPMMQHDKLFRFTESARSEPGGIVVVFGVKAYKACRHKPAHFVLEKIAI